MLPRAAQRCQLGGSGTSASGWSLAIALLLNLLALRAFVWHAGSRHLQLEVVRMCARAEGPISGRARDRRRTRPPQRCAAGARRTVATNAALVVAAAA